MSRRLFCELSPLTFRISAAKERVRRHVQDLTSRQRFAREQSGEDLPVLIHEHSSLIRRRLGGVDMTLQENKAVNLSLAAPLLDGILIRQGLTLTRGRTGSGVGGGMCQLSNLIHWMVLHTPLTIVEHYHHDGVDLFPDHERRVPFGTGSSICYNYLDYRFRNDTDRCYQLRVRVEGEYLLGELRADRPQPLRYTIRCEGERFVPENGQLYRVGQVWREGADPDTGALRERTLLRENHARVLYELPEDKQRG